jgi:hypothetical protein
MSTTFDSSSNTFFLDQELIWRREQTLLIIFMNYNKEFNVKTKEVTCKCSTIDNEKGRVLINQPFCGEAGIHHLLAVGPERL